MKERLELALQLLERHVKSGGRADVHTRAFHRAGIWWDRLTDEAVERGLAWRTERG